jgi:hypothetical protein
MTVMEQPKNFGAGSGLTHFRSALAVEAQRLRMLMDESTKSIQRSGSADDVVLFRLAADRRRSPTNILPYRQRRATDKGH